MSCPHCNSAVPSLPSRSRFCVGCGKRLPPSAAPVRIALPPRRPAGLPATVVG
jgi:hypothetical protein